MNKSNFLIRQTVDEVFTLSSKSYLHLTELINCDYIPKGNVFIKKGTLNEFEYFILQGICRSYLINPKEKEITISFFQQRSILPPHITRIQNNRSTLNFQALTNLEIAYFKASDFLTLMIENNEIREFGNTVLKNELLRKVEKEIGLVSTPAKERLLQFRQHFSMLENLIPHSQIASYLGITNISLSRLRKELSKE